MTLPAVPWNEAVRVWVRIALQSFGGPAGQISVMHRILVEEKGWLDERRFLHALNYCMLLPGPEAMQLVTYSGWLLRGVRGGLVAGALFILPGFLSILALSIAYVHFAGAAAVDGLLFGLKATILAVMVEAVLRIGRRTIRNRVMLGIAVAAFLALFVFQVPFPLVIVGAGVVGWVGDRFAPRTFETMGLHAVDGDVPPPIDRPWRRAGWVVAVGATLWLLPLVLLAVTVGNDHTLTREAWFFSGAAVVTFGGAYAVLAYVAQRAVETYAWLSPGEMLDGLGMAESTPGPLIQVVQFVGFMGAYRFNGDFDPMLAGVLASVVVTWVTFVPSFLFVFLGAPHVEQLRGRARLSAALSSITAAVTGVIANLALWFAVHTLFADVWTWRGMGFRLIVPVWSTFDVAAAVIAVAAGVALLRYHIGLGKVLVVGVAVGLVWRLVG